MRKTIVDWGAVKDWLLITAIMCGGCLLSIIIVAILEQVRFNLL